MSDIRFSKRQMEILGLMPEGLSYNLLARRMGISSHAVKQHLGKIYQKMDCCNQVQVVVKALRMGIISLDTQRKAA